LGATKKRTKTPTREKKSGLENHQRQKKYKDNRMGDQKSEGGTRKTKAQEKSKKADYHLSRPGK